MFLCNREKCAYAPCRSSLIRVRIAVTQIFQPARFSMYLEQPHTHLWMFSLGFASGSLPLVLRTHVSQTLCSYLWMASITVIDITASATDSGSPLVEYCLFWLQLSLAISYFMECIFSYQIQTPASPTEQKLGSQTLTVVNSIELQKTPTNTHHMLPSEGRLISWFQLYDLGFQHDMTDVERKCVGMIR